MQLADRLDQTWDAGSQDGWENGRTPTPVRRCAVRLQSLGLSVRGTQAVLEWLGAQRSHGAIWQWRHRLAATQDDPPSASPSRVAVDETRLTVDGQDRWLYAAIDVDSKVLLDVELFSRRGTDPAAAFLHRLSRTTSRTLNFSSMLRVI